ncbi:diacylglycerol kinase (ATP) [Thermocatellispora tengchongensis]|uniref:Diacylglycerol kinase (ATP) n=1 Tax=Thermocatellispora tengchongensis TaxID=1073253 RepID=A0A840PEB0_9ACTN|nr:YegS/Rv2252/BmrU family lipid kinase [Thermocatellispora tengchongensis]MBB5135790.1 diacylglycerol kinase (ATP) [Thermocatellispora tengchongensis]
MPGAIALLVNPAARGGRSLRLLAPTVRRLREGGAEVSVIAGASAEEALERACTAVAERPDALVAFGGDGLVHLAVQAAAGTDVPLGIIPAGTGNDIARALGIPAGDTASAARIVLAGRTRDVDAARIGADHWFAGVVACGFDSRVNERANARTWPPGMARYLFALVEELRAFTPIPFTITLDTPEGREVIEREAMLVAIGNTRSYGAGMRVCPGASPYDGLLDVTMLGALPTGEFLRAFPRVYRGTHLTHRAVTVRRATRVEISAAAGHAVVAYADGERVGPVPFSCTVVPRALKVLAP